MFYCISKLRLSEIIERENLEKGKFICCLDLKQWVAIDNSLDEKFMEVFKSCEGALIWLKDMD